MNQGPADPNYIDPSGASSNPSQADQDIDWSVVPFRHPQRLDVRSLLKVAEAADPTVSSLAVFADREGEL